MIRATDLKFSYGAFPTLSGLSFSIETGDFIGIVGPNGSGKSTLLRVLSKLLQPASGSIAIDDTRLDDLSLRQLATRMAVVGSEAQFAFPFPVRDVVMMGRTPFLGRFSAPSATDHQIVEGAMRKTESWEFRDRYIHELSSGERQRVLLARALAQAPKILLLDEPTAHLDLHYEIEIFRILKTLNERDRLTVVAVSHNLNLVAEFCNRILLLVHGACRCIGTPGEVLTPDLLEEVFRIQCHIEKNPFSGAPNIVLNIRPE